MKRRYLGLVASVLACGIAYAGPTEDGIAARGKKDFATALRLLTEAANQKDARAQSVLGEMYVAGEGVAVNPREAIRLFTLSAEQGNADGQANLAISYENGFGVSRDYKKAMEWALRSAQQGNADGEFIVGDLYSKGLGLAADNAKAVEWFNRAIAQGNGHAQSRLAYHYLKGAGVPQDYFEALRLLRLAAQQDVVEAQLNLGDLYAYGMGVRQDLVRAYMWYNIGVTAEPTAQIFVTRRNLLARELSATDVARAQILGRQCVDSKFENCGADSKDGAKDENASPDGKPRAYASGTGFYVSAQGHIITNNHVVDGCKEMRSPSLGTLKVLAVDKTSDLALLGGETPQPLFAHLRGGRGVRIGESIIAIGYPLSDILGSDVKVTIGAVSALSGINNDRNTIQISAPIQPGNSGGPVIGEDGSLVGVSVASIKAVEFAEANGVIPQNVNFAVSLGTLQSFLNAQAVPYMLETRTARQSSADIAAEATRFTLYLECWK